MISQQKGLTMKRTLAALAAAAGLFAAGIVVLTGTPASATIVPGGPNFSACPNLNGWYVNPDETDRQPTPAEDGLKFSGDDLVHHVASLTTDTLTPGSFTASPAPDQPSFFSVEVRDSDGSGYATLRWNTTTSKWNMVTGGQFYENANATSLVKMSSPPRSQNVFSFGVGYTKNPPGTVTTTVSKVRFNGTDYLLTCPVTKPSKPVDDTVPPGHPSHSPEASLPATTSPPSSTASPNPSDSPDSPIIAAAGPSLPVTGPGAGTFVAVGSGLVAIGTVLTWLLRRRKVTFSG